MFAIDPNATQSTLRADRWYRVRPGSDVALVLSLIQVIIDEDLHDVEFLKSQSVAPFLVREDTGVFLRESDLGVEPIEGPPDAYGMPTIIDPPVVWDGKTNAAGPESEVPDPEIEGSYVVEGIKVSTAFTLLKEHVQQYAPSEVSDAVDLTEGEILEIAHICADGPVTHVIGLGSQNYDNGMQLGTATGTLMAVTGNLGKPGAGVAPLNVQAPINIGLIVPPTFSMSNTVSVMSMAQIINEGTWLGEDYPIKSIWFNGSGAPSSTTNYNEFMEALEKVDFLVTADVCMTNAARVCDIVLPVAHPFEQENIYSSALEGELPHSEKMVEPAFESKSNVDIALALGRGMGLGGLFEGTEEDVTRAYLDAEPFISNGITLEALREKHTMRFRKKGFLYADGYTTPSGRIEFYCESPRPRIVSDKELDSASYRLPTFTKPHEVWEGTEAMSKYPLAFMYQRNHFRFHQTGTDGVWVNEIEMEPIARINEVDAGERGINDGDLVEFYNDRGFVVMRVYTDPGVRQGVVIYDSKGLRTDQYVSGDPVTMMQNRMDPYAVNQSFFDCTADMRVWNGEEA